MQHVERVVTNGVLGGASTGRQKEPMSCDIRERLRYPPSSRLAQAVTDVLQGDVLTV